MANTSNFSTTGNYIKNTVTRFRSVLISQLPYFFPDTVKSGKGNIEPTCKYISARGYIDMDMNTGILTSVGSCPDQKQIDCIWVAIDMLSREASDVKTLDRLLGSLVSINDSPESLCFIANGNCLIRAIAVENEYEALNILAAQTHICNIQDIPETAADQSEYMMLIVIRDKKLLGHISKYNLKIPHKIALLSGGLLEKPTIAYFGTASSV